MRELRFHSLFRLQSISTNKPKPRASIYVYSFIFSSHHSLNPLVVVRLSRYDGFFYSSLYRFIIITRAIVWLQQIWMRYDYEQLFDRNRFMFVSEWNALSCFMFAMNSGAYLFSLSILLGIRRQFLSNPFCLLGIVFFCSIQFVHCCSVIQVNRDAVTDTDTATAIAPDADVSSFWWEIVWLLYFKYAENNWSIFSRKRERERKRIQSK